MKTRYSNCNAVIVNTLDEFASVVREHGPLLTVGLAYRLAGVSGTYFYRLLEEGRMRKFVVYGEFYVSEAEFIEWRTERTRKRLQASLASSQLGWEAAVA